MKERKYTKKDGSEGIEYKPEHGDEIVAVAESVFESQPRPVIVDKGTDKERAVNIITYGIAGVWNGKEIFCKLTEGHKKALSNFNNLRGRKLKFENYESKNYGTLVGVNVVKESQ